MIGTDFLESPSLMKYFLSRNLSFLHTSVFMQDAGYISVCIHLTKLTYVLYYYLLTLCSRILLKLVLWNPNVHYRSHKCPPPALSWASSIQSTPPHPTSWRSILFFTVGNRKDYVNQSKKILKWQDNAGPFVRIVLKVCIAQQHRIFLSYVE